MKKIISLLVAGISIFTLFTELAFASFPDVTNVNYKKAVDWLQENGVVQGYSDGTFRPENEVTRAEFLKMLYETIGMENLETTLPFTDIDQNAWYMKYLKEAYASHVINGYSDGTFKPNSNISFKESVKIITSALFDVDSVYGNGSNTAYSCPQNFFTSSPLEGDVKDWSLKFINVAEQFCITDFALSVWGMAGFLADAAISRGDMAEMIYRAKAVYDNGNIKYDGKIEPKSKSQQVTKVSVEIKNFAFSPSTLTVKKGTIVTWTNKDSVNHTVTGDSGKGPDSGDLWPGDTENYVFSETGTFNYHCTPHPNMKGTVIVTE